jgi:hypothetical protein
MWIFTIYGFYSVACVRRGREVNTDIVAIRARDVKHLQNLMRQFPALRQKVLHLKGRDYCCRIVVKKTVWANVVRALTLEQTWDNFKDAAAVKVQQRDPAYIAALHSVWSRMFELQEGPIWQRSRQYEIGFNRRDDDPADELEQCYGSAHWNGGD